MKIINIAQGSDEWADYRKGKISGTMLSQLYAKRGGRKLGFYQVIAERLGLGSDGEDCMDRGLRLEDEAVKIFEDTNKLKIERVGICVSDFNSNVINSPDGLIKDKKGKYSKAVEIKCLNTARHLQAIIEDKIPSEFESQMLQYFIVNKDLEELYFIFYDDRILSRPYFQKVVKRDEVKDKIEFFKNFQIETLKEIDKIIEELAF